jgi:phosphohistidine phosphatase
MKTLLLLRHAKAEAEGDSDHERRLNDRGRKAAVRMGAFLAERGFFPDVAVCSTAARTVQTAERALIAAGYARPIRYEPTLYLAEPSAIVALVAALEDSVERALVLGHNPGLEDLLFRLSGRHENMPTGALAVLELPLLAWRDFPTVTRAALEGVYRPRELD